VSPLKIKIPCKNLDRQRCAERFNSGIKGLNKVVRNRGADSYTATESWQPIKLLRDKKKKKIITKKCTINILTLSLLMSHICAVSKKFGEWYQKTEKTDDTNKLTLLAFKIIAILHNTLLATFKKLVETVSKGLGGNPRTCDSCSAIDS
jgi:hypothetical protein